MNEVIKSTAKLLDIPKISVMCPIGNRARLTRLVGNLPTSSYLLQVSDFAATEYRTRRPKTSTRQKSGDTLEMLFEDNPSLGEGRRASLNGVMFGRLTTNSRISHPETTLVAIKPYIMSQDPDKAVDEFAYNNYLNSINNKASAYIPLGFGRLENGAYTLITKYDSEVNTFDNVFWATGEKASKIDEPRVIDAVEICMNSLGYLLGAGVAHGDARVKNLAYGRYPAMLRFVDLEESTLLGQAAWREIVANDDNKQAINNDIDTFFGTCIGWGDVNKLVVNAFSKSDILTVCRESYVAGVKSSSRDTGISVPSKLLPTKKELATAIHNAIEMQDY